MKLAAAIEQLERIHAHDRRDSVLVVEYDPGHATVGGSPAKLVRQILPGFDWDAGKVIVTVEGGKLCAPSDQAEQNKKTMHQRGNALAMILYVLGHAGINTEQKLKAIAEHAHKGLGTRQSGPGRAK